MHWSPITTLTDPPPTPRDGEGPLQPGDLVDGTYRVRTKVGGGSMGIVYRAHDERLDRAVALKMMRACNFGDTELREQFEAEARAQARVRHPNVVEVYAFGYLGSAPYLVMEYVDGPDLRRWRSQRGRELALDEMVGVLDPLCRGVQAVHEAGTVHRDIKPANVLVGPAFRIALADLGLARPFEDIEFGRQRMVAGTPAYMAPEIVDERDVPPELAPRVDVYALGVVAFELLTGRWPVPGRSSPEMLQAQVYEPPHRLCDFRPELPASLDEVLAAALRKDPRERLESADSLRRALHRARRDAQIGPSTPRHILIVDDDPDYAHLIAEWIRASGLATVTEADNGLDALARLQELGAPPDLVIADLHMPVMGGAALVTELRSRNETHDVPVVIVTGLGGAPDWTALEQLGASGFLVKPVAVDQLLSTVRRLLTTSE